MSNLFFVYTPFQLYVAQEIICQEHLTDNILLKGYVGNNTQFLEIYEYIKVPELWQKEYLFPDLNDSYDVDVHKPLSSIKKIKLNHKKITDIVSINRVESIFLGEINNYPERYVSLIFHRKNIKICFFEEGASHYSVSSTGGILRHKPIISRLYQFFFDAFLYIPVLHQRIGRWMFVEPMKFSELYIDSRYSIIPKFNEVFDKQLYCSGVIGQKAKELIAKECEGLSVENSILFLDQPIYEVVRNSMSYYLNTIEDYISTLAPDTNVVIKYHPRETVEVRRMIEDLFSKHNIWYVVISKEINLPVELYIQQLRFKKVVNFYTSTALYNGYLFKEVEFEFLIENFYHNCLKNNLPESHIIEGMVNEYKSNVKN